jgi:hypothetical protein
MESAPEDRVTIARELGHASYQASHESLPQTRGLSERSI